MDSEKLKLLKSLHLLDQIPDKELATLGQYLKPKALNDGDVIFEEGSKGSSLFFVSVGHIRIAKKLADKKYKDLAILGPGDAFGEMALMEETARSARASAQGDTVVFELSRQDLDKWLKSNPAHVMQFFAELVQVQSKRLRRTSNELALLSDLSALLLEPHATSKEMLLKVLERVAPHLEGSWSAAAYLYNVFNDDMDFIARHGDFNFDAVTSLPKATETRSLWLDDSTYYVSLPGQARPLGYLIFRSHSAEAEEARNEMGRTLTTVARLVTSAIENINYRNEDSLRARLKGSAHGSSL